MQTFFSPRNTRSKVYWEKSLKTMKYKCPNHTSLLCLAEKAMLLNQIWTIWIQMPAYKAGPQLKKANKALTSKLQPERQWWVFRFSWCGASGCSSGPASASPGETPTRPRWSPPSSSSWPRKRPPKALSKCEGRVVPTWWWRCPRLVEILKKHQIIDKLSFKHSPTKIDLLMRRHL